MAPEYDYDLLVIGGGAAGLTTAAGAAQLGVKTLLVEREPQLGGDCLHHGCVPSKTLLHTAKVYRMMQRSEDFGLPPMFPPPVEFSRVAARIREVIETIQHHDSVERFCALGTEVRFGAARFVDDHTVEITGEDGVWLHTAKQVLIATGSSPARPALPGLDTCSTLSNMDIFRLKQLPPSLTVLGGGAIACEMAQAFARLGSRVTLVQRSKQLLSKEDEDMAAVVEEALRADSVDVMTGAQVVEVMQERDHKAAICETDRGLVKVMSAEILVALGRAPNLGGLDLENAGVEFGPQGIAVDGRMRTSAKHIYAAGDVTGKHQFTHAAGYEAGIVISNAVFRLPRKADYTLLPHCTYTDPELASLGLNEKAANKAGLKYSVHSEDFKDNDRAQAEGATEGRIKLVLDGNGKPRGVQIAGRRAGDLLGEWIAHFAAGGKLTSLAGAVHPYPTLGEINKRVAGSVVSEKLFSPTVKKILHLLFDYKGRACTPPK